MDGGAWWATVHGVAKSQTRLSNLNLTNYSELGVFSLGTVDITVRIKSRARIRVAGWLGLTPFSQLLVWYPEKMHRRKKQEETERETVPSGR